MHLTPKFVSLYKKLKLKYPGKWYEGYQQQILWNSLDLYPDFYSEYCVIDKLLQKQHSRRKRVRKYIRNMIVHRGYDIPCLVSLTFTDDCLNSTIFSTRKDYVREFLNELFTDWFACVDYGKKNGREHYHAIALLSFRVKFFTFEKKGKKFILPIYSLLDWAYGFYSIRPLDIDPSDIYKSLNYAFKSSFYAFKSSTDSVKPFHKRGLSYDDPGSLFW